MGAPRAQRPGDRVCEQLPPNLHLQTQTETRKVSARDPECVSRTDGAAPSRLPRTLRAGTAVLWDSLRSHRRHLQGPWFTPSSSGLIFYPKSHLGSRPGRRLPPSPRSCCWTDTSPRQPDTQPGRLRDIRVCWHPRHGGGGHPPPWSSRHPGLEAAGWEQERAG